MFNRSRAGWLGLLLSLAVAQLACGDGRTIPRDDGGDASGRGGAGGRGGAVTDGGAGTGGNGSGGTAGSGPAGASGSGGVGGSSGGASGSGGTSGTSGTTGNAGTGGTAGAAGSGAAGGRGGAGGTGGTNAGGTGGAAGGRGGTAGTNAGGRGGSGGTSAGGSGGGSGGRGGAAGTNAGGSGGSGGRGGSGGSGGSGGGTGGFCGAAQHMCPAGCLSNTSIDSCGTTSCSACPPPGLANGTATCDGTSCGVGCLPGYGLCRNSNGTTNSCSRTVFDFNDGTTQGWMNTNGGTFSTSSTIRHGTSGASLTFSVVKFSGQLETSVHFPLCTSSSMNLMGKTVSAWIYIDGDPLPSCGELHDMGIQIVNTSAMKGSAASATPQVKQWFPVSGTVTTSAGMNAAEVDVTLYIGCDTQWLGSVYVDDVTIGG